MLIADRLKLVLGLSIFVSFFVLTAFKNAHSGLLFTCLIGVAAVWGLWGVCKSIITYRKSKSWPRVKFTLLQGNVNVQSPPAGKGYHTKYTPVFQLQYEYEGEKRVCKSDDLKGLEKRVFYTLEDAQNILNDMRAGGEAAVCPEDPTILFLKTGVSGKHISTLVICSLMTVFSVLVVITLIHSLLAL